MLCQDCPDRNSCLKLCSEAEVYVDQDCIKLREKTIGLPVYSQHIDGGPSHTPLTEREKDILRLLGMGIPREKICRDLNMTPGALRFAIYIIRGKAVVDED